MNDKPTEIHKNASFNTMTNFKCFVPPPMT